MTPSTAWMHEAACRQVDDPEIFFQQGYPKQALAFCHQCPVRLECLEYSLILEGDKWRFGVFGGVSPNQRARIKNRRRRLTTAL